MWTDTDTIGNSIAFQEVTDGSTEACQITIAGDISARGTLSATDARFGDSSIRMYGDAGNLYVSNCIASGQHLCSPDIISCAWCSCVMDFNVNLSTETTFVGNLCAAMGEGACDCKVGIGVDPTEKLTVGGNISVLSGGLGAGGLVAQGGLSAQGANNYFSGNVDQRYRNNCSGIFINGCQW